MSQGLILPGEVRAPDQAAEPEPKKGEAPALMIEFHPETQSVSVKINPDKIKTWDFARAVCGMAVQACERMAEVQMAKAAQAAMQNSAMVNGVMQELRGPGRRRG